MNNQNLPAIQEKVTTIRTLLEKSKSQLQMAIPKHLTVDRLLRVAMTSIRTNRRLLDCTPESLLACIMGCAQLGLEPEPFLGQAYLVPFWNEKKKVLEATLIPGYRGYLALARRSGEVQSVTAQVVYSNDHFKMSYGLKEVLDHTPAEGDRGTAKGAYVVFRYKDGSHSFDYMSVADIDKIKERSKSRNKQGELTGPWVTDENEMRKKTVIRRHIKLVPLSVEMATAAAAEERAHAGESQAGLFLDTQEAEFTELPGSNGEANPEAVTEYEKLAEQFPEGEKILLKDFVKATAKAYQCSEDEIKVRASQNFENFKTAFGDWKEKQKKKPGRPPKIPGVAPGSPVVESGTETKTIVQEPEESPATEPGDLPKPITNEQFDELRKVPGEILKSGYQNFGISPILPLKELTAELADELLDYVRAK